MIRKYQPVPVRLKQLIYWRDDYTCQRCGLKDKPGRSYGNIQIHHKIPYQAGGEHTPDNLIVLCFECHRIIDREWSRIANAWARYKNNDNHVAYLSILNDYPK